MNVNGHFASAGQNGKADFEHGIQVIDEDKEFKYATKDGCCRAVATTLLQVSSR
jgi:hypothetical protein